MYLLFILILTLKSALALPLPDVLRIFETMSVQTALSPDQCISLETDDITAEVKACLVTSCGDANLGEIQKAREEFATYSNPEAQEYFSKTLPEINHRIMADERLLPVLLERGKKLLPETASPEDQSNILGNYFLRFIDTHSSEENSFFDPYGELTEGQKKILREQYLPQRNSSFRCQGPYCLQAFLEIPDVVQYRELILHPPETFIGTQNQARSQCRLAFHAEAAEVHYTARNEEFRRRLSTVKENFLNLLAKKYSSETMTELRSYMNRVKLTLNSTDSPFYDTVIENIRRSPDEFNGSAFANNFNALLNFRAGKGLSPYAPLMSACENEYLIPHGSFADGSIYLSQFSTFVPELAEQIYAHELGHALSEFFRSPKASASSKKIYLTQRSCVTSLHSDNTTIKEFEFFPGDSTRTEEEAGDFFQAISAPTTRPFMSCLNFSFDPLTGSYLDPLEKKSKHDEYSSNIVRLIFEMSQRKKSLPPSCLKVAAKLQLNLDRNCFSLP